MYPSRPRTDYLNIVVILGLHPLAPAHHDVHEQEESDKQGNEPGQILMVAFHGGFRYGYGAPAPGA